MNIWLTEHEAAKYVNRTPRTLEHWRHNKKVLARKRRGTWEYEKTSLTRCLAAARWSYEHRRIIPGPGRGRFLSPPDSPTLFDIGDADNE